MNGIVMWIIMGVLIIIVIGFLGVSATLDHKKKKKLEVETKRIDKIKDLAIGNIAIMVNIIFDANEKKLKHFVPSVGKTKMSDINNLAKTELDKIKKSEGYKFLKEHDIFLKHFNILLTSKSNNWSKKNTAEREFFTEVEKSLDLTKYKTLIKFETERIRKAYK